MVVFIMTIYYNSLPQIAIVTKLKTFFVHELEIKLQGILPRVTQPKNLAQIPAHKPGSKINTGFILCWFISKIYPGKAGPEK